MGEVLTMPPAQLDNLHSGGGNSHLGSHHHSDYLTAQQSHSAGAMSPPGTGSAASPESRADPFSSSSSLFAAFQPGGGDPFSHNGSVQQDGLAGGLLSFDFKQMGRELSELQGDEGVPSGGPPSLEKAQSYHSVASGETPSPHNQQQTQAPPPNALTKPPRAGGSLVPFGSEQTVGLPPKGSSRRPFAGFNADPQSSGLMNGHYHVPRQGGFHNEGLPNGVPAGGYAPHSHSHSHHSPHHTAATGGQRGLQGAGVPAAYFHPYNGSHSQAGPYGPAGLMIPAAGDPGLAAGGLGDPAKGYMALPPQQGQVLPPGVDGHDATVYAAHAGIGGQHVALPAGGPRFYFPGYDGAPILTLPHQGGGAVMAQAPTHHLVATAAGMSMLPINQLVTLPNGQVYQVMRAVSPVDGQCHPVAYPAMPFFLHPAAAAHGFGKSGYGSPGSDSRDGSPSRNRDDDYHRRRGDRDRDRDGREKRHGSKKRVERDPEVLAALSSAMHDDCPNLEDILKASSVHSLSQDQVGCRFLQLKLDEGGGESATLILNQAKPYLAEMMTDPFGNYLFQKLIEKVTDQERTSVLSHVRDRLVEAALNLHGTRSVQRLVEVCKSQEQIEMMVLALRNDVVRLCVDANGNHVIQRALQHLGPDDRGFIFDAISQHCVEVSTHRHGCCVMQRCLDAATSPQKRILVAEIGRHCLQLMQDPYGNYVVQYVLDRCTGEEIRAVTTCSLGRVASLSVQKYSSNVIEKCLERASEDVQAQLIEEMCSPGNIKHLMQDQYGNYVVQRALSVATHSKGLALVEAIRPHLHSMRNTAGGRRIVAKIAKRFPSVDLGSDLISPR